eukprot:1801060-Amphidinium_carterae.2
MSATRSIADPEMTSIVLSPLKNRIHTVQLISRVSVLQDLSTLRHNIHRYRTIGHLQALSQSVHSLQETHALRLLSKSRHPHALGSV